MRPSIPSRPPGQRALSHPVARKLTFWHTHTGEKTRASVWVRQRDTREDEKRAKARWRGGGTLLESRHVTTEEGQSWAVNHFIYAAWLCCWLCRMLSVPAGTSLSSLCLLFLYIWYWYIVLNSFTHAVSETQQMEDDSHRESRVWCELDWHRMS